MRPPASNHAITASLSPLHTELNTLLGRERGFLLVIVIVIVVVIIVKVVFLVVVVLGQRRHTSRRHCRPLFLYPSCPLILSLLLSLHRHFILATNTPVCPTSLSL